ncbi:UNVERIFIED_CONTAM: hypothetical protein GTU68_050015, partial [Idotea baltica]|nr:hypothetical protein [Idotea baltica]
MMESKTPLRLKLKIGNGRASTPEPPPVPHTAVVNKMTEEELDQMGSEDEGDYEDDWPDDQQGEEIGGEEDDSQPSRNTFTSLEDASRERHKKSKKKKKKKEREKERHKHKHHKERVEVDEEEPPAKKLMTHPPVPEKPSKASLAAFKELLEVLLQLLQKRDPQQFFAFPVTDAIAPGYSSIINQPMDFSRMQQKIQEGAYTQISQFAEDLRLTCNNCMTYNQPDTIYFKAAKKLFQAGERILSPERLLPLKREIPSMLLLSKEQLGFDVTAEIPCLDLEEGSRDSSRSDNENSLDQTGKFESLRDQLTAEEILEQTQAAAEEAAEKLTLKKPVSTLGFLRQRVDGTTTLNFLTGCEGNAPPNQKEKPISLGLLTGKLAQGSSSLHNYRDDKRSMAKPVKPLYYGTFSSFCPSYDSTFANLNKEESEMV